MRRLAPALVLLLVGCSNEGKFGTFNTEPAVTITSPPSGSTFVEGEAVIFQARVSDDQTADEDLYLEWTSEPGGSLSTTATISDGNVTYTTASLPPGNLVVRLSATDAMAATGFAEVTVTVSDLPDAPTLSVIHPISGESGQEDVEYRFVVQVTDAQDANEDLHVEFESDRDGLFCEPTPDATGYAECNHALSGGDHYIVFSVTDSDAQRTETTVLFPVLSANDVDDDGDGWTESRGDCNDGDASVNPNAPEVYNGRDDDCDGQIDEGTEGGDDDHDGYAEIDGDCNDGYAGTYPGATEVCDGADNDCDGTTDENTSCYDDDGDGYTENDGDCDDAYTGTYPRAPELEDGRDNDCDGTTDEGTNAYDDDGDGQTENAGDCNDGNSSIYRGATETCDGLDNDCDGSVDETGASGCTTWYYDGDRDGYGSTTSACLCSSSGYYDARTNNDCYDSNASANPAQTSWFSYSRGDSSYDFNCDGSESHYYSGTASSCYWDVFSCVTDRTGWASSDPGCGGRGTYVTGCYCSTEVLGICVACGNSTSSYTQYCH